MKTAKKRKRPSYNRDVRDNRQADTGGHEVKKSSKQTVQNLPPAQEPQTDFMDSLLRRSTQSTYGKRTLYGTGRLIDAMHDLKREEKHLSKIGRELGEARIDAAMAQWARMAGKTLSVFYENPVPTIIQKNPEVDTAVFDLVVLGHAIEQRRSTVYESVGRVVYNAYFNADLSFFKNLHDTLRRHTETPDRTRWVKWTLMLMVHHHGSFHLPFTLTQITKHLQSCWYTHDDKDLDPAYVSRLCKELKIVLTKGQPGFPRGKKKRDYHD